MNCCKKKKFKQTTMDSKQDDSDDDLPEINFKPDSPNKSDSSKSDFEMPSADVLLAQRLRLANQLKQIQCGTASIAETTLVENLEENELETDLGLQITKKKVGFMPTLPLDPLHNILKSLQFVFLENFVKALISDSKVTNLDNVIDYILLSLEGIMSQEDQWEVGDVVVVGTVLSVICICDVCRNMIRHLSRARALLYYVLEEICADSFQISQMGKAITKIVTDTEHRMDLVTLLEGRQEDHVRALTVGIVRKCMDELLVEYVSDEWINTPYTINTLLPLVSQKWCHLQFHQQWLLAELISKNLKQLEDFSDSNENIINDGEGRAKLFSVLASNIAKTHNVNDRCKLQILISRMQIYQSKIVQEMRDEDDAG